MVSPNRASGSFTTLGLYTERRQALFDRDLFEGLEISARIVRNRSGPTEVEYPLRISHRPVLR